MSQQTRYRYEKVALTPTEAMAAHKANEDAAASKLAAAANDLRDAAADYLETQNASPPTHRTVQIAVRPGDPGYDDIPPQFNAAEWQGDIRWLNCPATPLDPMPIAPPPTTPEPTPATDCKEWFEKANVTLPHEATEPGPTDATVDEAARAVLSCLRPESFVTNTELDRLVAGWMETAAQVSRDADYYRGLVVRCGEALGHPAKCCDDGTYVGEVLCDKVPEVLEAALERLSKPSATVANLRERLDRANDEIIRLSRLTADYLETIREVRRIANCIT